MRRHLGTVAILCVALSWVLLAQGWGGNQDSHHALVRALASGTPNIDETRYEVGSIQPVTPDISVHDGHTYSNKAPGLAIATLPAYFAQKAAGYAEPAHDPTGQLWFLGLWGVVVPGAILLLLVRRIGDELEPAFGTAAAVTLGLGTLLMPFATLYFSHVLAATLGFAAFAVLWYERRGPPRLAWVAAAGALAGYAVTTEFPSAIVAGILGCYALLRPGVLHRALAYGGGALLGLLPLLLFNAWAFGNPFHLSYASTVGFGDVGFFFLSAPSFDQAMELLFAPLGIITLTPVLAMGAVGIALLYRRGDRLEALLFGSIVVRLFVFNASFDPPFGGASPGPRYMAPMLPFAAVPLAVAYRRLPVTTLVLAAISIVEMVAITLTRPLSSSVFLNWFDRFADGDFSQTVIGLIGRSSRDGIYLFFAAAACAFVLAALATPRPRFTSRDAVMGGVLAAGWVIIERRGTELLDSDRLGDGNGAVLALFVGSAIVLVAVVLPRLFAPRR